MSTILEQEAVRVAEQVRLDRLKTAAERNKWGQFATPPTLALEIARFVWNKVKRRSGDFRFLDPAIGTGSFFSALVQAFPRRRIASPTRQREFGRTRVCKSYKATLRDKQSGGHTTLF